MTPHERPGYLQQYVLRQVFDKAELASLKDIEGFRKYEHERAAMSIGRMLVRDFLRELKEPRDRQEKLRLMREEIWDFDIKVLSQEMLPHVTNQRIMWRPS